MEKKGPQTVEVSSYFIRKNVNIRTLPTIVLLYVLLGKF